MFSEIITIGDELLIGQTIDTNSAWIAKQLNNIGISVRQITSIADSKEHIFETLDSAIKSSELVLITGGLGPTDDDITKKTLTEYFDTELITNLDVLKDVKNFIEKRSLKYNKRNIEQAKVPKNCNVIRNENGTAAGMWFSKNDTVIISMPAVPFEMKAMMTEKIIPLLEQHFNTSNVIHKTIQTFGISESSLAEQLSQWKEQLPKSLKLAYLPSPERMQLRLSCVSENKNDGKKNIDNEIEKLKKIIGEAIFGYGNVFLHEAIGDILIDKQETLAVAESCTGGNISRLITSVSGSSKYFIGGVVAYSNDIKEQILGVKKDTLIKHGAVSKQTVIEMANGIRRLYGSDYAISVSGIAGPGGSRDGKPVGTTWIAVAYAEKTVAKKYIFGKQRDINIRIASSKALDMLRRLMI